MSPNTQTFEFVQQVKASPASIYQAFTNSTYAREWLCDVAILDAKPGGHVFLAWNSGFYASGEFTHLEQNKSISFTWFGRGEPAITRVEVGIEEQAGGATVRLKHFGLGKGDEWSNMVKEVQSEWPSGLENLASVLETGVDLRFVRRPMLGITLSDFNEEIAQQMGVPVTSGVRLDNTIEGMGAHAAGLRSGDVIVGIGERVIVNYPDLTAALQSKRAGDQVKVEFYRGPEKETVMMTLSGRRIPPIPDSIGALAQALGDQYKISDSELDAFLDGVSDEEASCIPAPGEWSIKEVLAHLIHGERGYRNYVTEVVGGAEAHYDNYASNSHAYVQATVAVYPTLTDMRQALKHCRQETLELFARLPASLMEHKGSYWRLAYGALEGPYHHQVHMEQIQAALQAARA